MKFSTSILTLLLSALVASEGLSFLGGNQNVLDDDPVPVPGENPLTFCNKDHADDILVLNHVNLNPNPPEKGASLSIEVEGELHKEVEKGAYVRLQVKYGLIRLVNTQADLCDQVSNVDLECPLKKGKTTITKDVKLPTEIPPGKYTVFADAYTKDDEHIVCLEAAVTFK